MGIVKYNKNRQFSISKSLKDGWGKEFKYFDELIGLKLQDRKKIKNKVVIENYDWCFGIFRIFYKGGGWQCFDHAIEQYKVID